MSDRILIETGRGVLIWQAEGAHLIGPEPLVREITSRLAANPEIDLTPTGPRITSTPADSRAVLAVLFDMRLAVYAIHGAEQADDLPADAVA